MRAILRRSRLTSIESFGAGYALRFWPATCTRCCPAGLRPRRTLWLRTAVSAPHGPQIPVAAAEECHPQIMSREVREHVRLVHEGAPASLHLSMCLVDVRAFEVND